MSTNSHSPTLARFGEGGRPPYYAAPANRPCTHVHYYTTGDMTRERQCQMKAAWTVPEVAYCAHHLPLELVAVARARMARWQEEAAWVWAAIVTEHPVPEP